MVGSALEFKSQDKSVKSVSGLRHVETVKSLHSDYQTLQKWWRERTTYRLYLSSRDSLFEDALTWALGLPAADGDSRSLELRTVNGPRQHGDEDMPIQSLADGEALARSQLVVQPRAVSEQNIVLDGHTISVVVQEPEREKATTGQPDYLQFTCESREGQQAVVKHLTTLLDVRKNTKRKPTMRWINPYYNSWTRRGDIPPRPMSSVVLADGQMEKLSTDLEQFLDAEKDYNDKAIPWHRGYMLHGAPGNGKTSVVKALANHFGLDLWYVPLGDIHEDTGLMNLLGEVSPRSILLLEDVDVFAATKERGETGARQLSLSGLLNSLDGFATPHGLITFMTTNKLEVIDDALLRPGRMDVVEEIKSPDYEQFMRMFKQFYGCDTMYPVNITGKTSAEIYDVFKRNMHNPHGALKELRDNSPLSPKSTSGFVRQPVNLGPKMDPNPFVLGRPYTNE